MHPHRPTATLFAVLILAGCATTPGTHAVQTASAPAHPQTNTTVAPTEAQSGPLVTLHVSGGIAGIEREVSVQDNLLLVRDLRRNTTTTRPLQANERAELERLVAQTPADGAVSSTRCADCLVQQLIVYRAGKAIGIPVPSNLEAHSAMGMLLQRLQSLAAEAE